MKRLVALLGFALFLLFPTSVAAADCQFVLGFKTVRDLIGHEIVGACLESERYNHIGDGLQQTTGGLLVWRKTDNWTAFTDGYRTWINGPNGLVQRLNTERFAWEADYAPGLVSLRRSDPEAAAAIEALPWVRDGIRSHPPLYRGFEFELNRVSDLIDLAHNSRSAFTNLIGKPRILNDFAPFPRTEAVRGVAGDLWADVIIGQPDFSQVSEEQVVPFKVFNPGGVVVDRSVSPGRAYIWDAGNSRILGIDLSTCYAGEGPCSADVVIGQPSAFDHSACNGDSNLQNFPVRAAASAETLCGIIDVAISVDEEHTFVTMAVDAHGNLYVPDSLNNRVLKYNRPFETDSIADEVWGQSDFSGIVCNRDSPTMRPNRESLCFHSATYRVRMGWFASGVEIDPAGNLWVADAANHRVLRYPIIHTTGVIAKQADLVLGQSGFQSNSWGAGRNELDSPAAVRTDARGHVYVADKGNNRILVFAPPFTSGMAATTVISSNLSRPTTLEIDPTRNGVWINSSDSNSLSFWPMRGSGTRASQLSIPGRSGGGIGIDSAGNLLLPLISFTQDVYRFPASRLNTHASSIGEPDKRLFYPPGGINFKGDREIRNGTGVAVFKDQLIAADTKRLLFWNGVAGLRNGQPADGIVGEAYWTPAWETCCGQIKVDGAGRLWVLGTDVTRYINVYQLPLTTHSEPIKTIAMEGATFPVLGTHRWVTLGRYIRGVAPIGNGEAIWISDSHNHRVVRLRDPLTNPVVDVILGQRDTAGTKCNRRAHIGPWDRPQEVVGAPQDDMLCFPGALSMIGWEISSSPTIRLKWQAIGGSWYSRAMSPLQAMFQPSLPLPPRRSSLTWARWKRGTLQMLGNPDKLLKPAVST